MAINSDWTLVHNRSLGSKCMVEAENVEKASWKAGLIQKSVEDYMDHAKKIRADSFSINNRMGDPNYGEAVWHKFDYNCSTFTN